LHLGVIYYHRGDRRAAQKAWEESFKQHTHFITLRNLAFLACREGRTSEGGRLYLAARELNPGLAPLAFECLQSLIADGQCQRALALFGQLSPVITGTGRARLIKARAAVLADELDVAEELLRDLEVADNREGEV
jgi:hypothetical protein